MLTISPDGGGFSLRRTNAGSKDEIMHLTMDDAINLVAQAEHLRRSIESTSSRQSAAAVVATEIREIRAAGEAMGDKLLILMTALDGRTLSYAVSQALAAQLSSTLQRELARMANNPRPTRQ